MANQALIQSGRDLFRARGEQVDHAKAIGEGFDLINNQIEKNMKMDREAEDREYLLKKRAREEQLAEMSLEEKMLEAEASKGEMFNLAEGLQERGLIEIPNYAQYKADRDAWYKDETNRLKLAQTLGDKEKSRERLNTAMKGEQNWENIVGWSRNATISDSSPEAQRIDLAVENMVKQGVTPRIVTVNGVDHFELIDPFGQKINIPATRFGAEDGNIAGEYDEPLSLSGVMNSFEQQNQDLIQTFEAGRATPQDFNKMGRWIDTELDTDTKIQEVANTIFQRTGFNMAEFTQDYPNAEIVENEAGELVLDTDKNTPGIQTAGAKEMIKEMFVGIYETEYPGISDNVGKLTLEEQETLADIEYKKSQASQKYADARQTIQELNLSQDEIRQRTLTYENYINNPTEFDVQDLVGFEGITSVKKNDDDVWEITMDDGAVFEGGTGAKPDNETVRNVLGVPQDHDSFSQYY